MKACYILRNAELSDSGLYDCRAKNKAGQDNKAFRVQIQVRPKIFGPKLETREAFLNTPVVLACDANGIPTPVWTFYNVTKILIKSYKRNLCKILL